MAGEKVDFSLDNKFEIFRNEEINSVLGELEDLKQQTPKNSEKKEKQDPPNFIEWFKSSELNKYFEIDEDLYDIEAMAKSKFQRLDIFPKEDNKAFSYQSIQIAWPFNNKEDHSTYAVITREERHFIIQSELNSLNDCEQYLLDLQKENQALYDFHQTTERILSLERFGNTIEPSLESYLHLKNSHIFYENGIGESLLIFKGQHIGNIGINVKDKIYFIEDLKGHKKTSSSLNDIFDHGYMQTFFASHLPEFETQRREIQVTIETLSLLIEEINISKFDFDIRENITEILKNGKTTIILDKFINNFFLEAEIEVALNGQITYKSELLNDHNLKFDQGLTFGDFRMVYDQLIGEFDGASRLSKNEIKEKINIFYPFIIPKN